MSDALYIPRGDLHVVTDEDTHVLFHPPSLTFFKVNQATADLMDDYVAAMPVRALCQKYDATSEEMEGFFQGIKGQIETALSDHRAKREEREKKRREEMQECACKEHPLVLNRLTLNVSNDCNLRCRYCYADTGAYGASRGLMKLETATRAIDAVYDHFDGLNGIQFFGGEPGLNVPVMKGVCAYLESLHKQEKIPRAPGYGMVTNGTVLNRKFFDVIKTYKIGATVSVDGPPEVHDRIRIYPSGRGSYAKAARLIKTLQEENESRVGVETTYTSVHLEQGISMPELMDFLYEELDIRSPHIPPVGAPADPALALYPDYEPQTNRTYADAVSHTIRSATTESWRSFSLGERQIQTLVHRREIPYICPASGTATLSISAEGDIYPCFMFIGKEDFKMGNVFEEGFSDPRFEEVNARFEANAKAKRADCQVCWVRGLCSGCLGANYNDTGSIFEVPEIHCNLVKAMAERTLVELARVRSQPEQWDKLVENMTKWPEWVEKEEGKAEE